MGIGRRSAWRWQAPPPRAVPPRRRRGLPLTAWVLLNMAAGHRDDLLAGGLVHHVTAGHRRLHRGSGRHLRDWDRRERQAARSRPHRREHHRARQAGVCHHLPRRDPRAAGEVMPTYPVEAYVPWTGADGLQDDAARAASAASELRLLIAFFLPADETGFLLYDAASRSSWARPADGQVARGSGCRRRSSRRGANTGHDPSWRKLDHSSDRHLTATRLRKRLDGSSAMLRSAVRSPVDPRTVEARKRFPRRRRSAGRAAADGRRLDSTGRAGECDLDLSGPHACRDCDRAASGRRAFLKESELLCVEFMRGATSSGAAEHRGRRDSSPASS